MPVEIWDRLGTVFHGQLMQPTSGSVQFGLSSAARIEISAPYVRWRNLMEIAPAFQLLKVSGPSGEVLCHGYWHTRDDDPLASGNMVIGGLGLLDELRVHCLSMQYVFTNQSTASACAAVLGYATGWALGDTSLMADPILTAQFDGDTVLEALGNLCETSGNFFRCNELTRTVDIFATAYPAVVASLVYAGPGQDLLLAPGVVRVLNVAPTDDTAELLRAVAPMGATYRDEKDMEHTLVPTGAEVLPSGFSWQQIGGQLFIVNTSVAYGLERIIEFGNVQALSNMEVSASGKIESCGAGYLRSNAVRRPSDNFWTGGKVTIQEQEFEVASHVADTLSGNWPNYAVGVPFSVSKQIEWDEDALDLARETLITATCAYLRANSQPYMTANVAVRGLSVLPMPGDTVSLQCIAFAEDEQGAMDSVHQRFMWNGFYGNLVVVGVTFKMSSGPLELQLDLANNLAQPPTDSGVTELRALSPKRKGASLGRGRGDGYTVRITSTDTACGTGGHMASLTFPTAYATTPQVLEVIALDQRYTAYVTSIGATGMQVCATSTVAFDEVNVLVRVREP